MSLIMRAVKSSISITSTRIHYRAIELKANYETMSEAMQQPENYIKGTLRPLMETTARIAEPTQQLSEGMNFKLTAGILFAEMRNRQVSQIIFKGENKSYVYDQSFLKLREEDYLLRTESIPIPAYNSGKGTYQIYSLFIRDGYYDNGTDDHDKNKGGGFCIMPKAPDSQGHLSEKFLACQTKRQST